VRQLGDEEARLVRAAGEPEQREREEDERDEGEEREVGDHRRQVGTAVDEELVDQPREPLAHERAVS
jgi:hypothetical protein